MLEILFVLDHLLDRLNVGLLARARRASAEWRRVALNVLETMVLKVLVLGTACAIKMREGECSALFVSLSE